MTGRHRLDDQPGRADHGADDQWADELHAMRRPDCLCSHPAHDGPCPRAGCGCRRYRTVEDRIDDDYDRYLHAREGL